MTNYSTFIFDCDGVVLNSNSIKTKAFYDVAKVYGKKPAQNLKDFHIQNGGISRYAKFTYFLTHILGKPLNQRELDSLLEKFSMEVKNALLTCEVAEGLQELRAHTEHAKWLIVSGGDQVELREVFVKIGLDKLFDGGIFGSPDTKDTILKRETEKQNITRPCVFLGDSKYDYQAASQAGLEFIFVSQWTEVKDWSDWASAENIVCRQRLLDMVHL